MLMRSTTISKKEVITTTVLSNLKNPTIRTQTVSREELITVYGKPSNNSSSSSLSNYTKQAVGMFDQSFKNQSANNSLSISDTYRDSPLFKEGIGGIINNLVLRTI